MEITIPGADFSARNLGNINYYANALTAMGITTGNTAYTAFKNFLIAFEAAGFRNDMERAYLFGGGTALSDSVDIISLLDASKIAFQNDISSAHTIDGYQPDLTALRCGIADYIPTDFTNIHSHNYVNTADPNPAAGGPSLCGTQSNGVSGQSVFQHYVILHGGEPVLPRVMSGQRFGTPKIGTDLTTSFVGLITGYRSGTNGVISAKGVVNASGTMTGPAVLNPATSCKWGIGCQGNITGALTAGISNARQRFAAWGKNTWTQAKDLQLSNMLDILEAAI